MVSAHLVADMSGLAVDQVKKARGGALASENYPPKAPGEEGGLRACVDLCSQSDRMCRHQAPNSGAQLDTTFWSVLLLQTTRSSTAQLGRGVGVYLSAQVVGC